MASNDIDIMKLPSLASILSYPLHWLSSAGSPCGWFSSPNQGVGQVTCGRVRAENDICLVGTPSDVQGFDEFDRAAFSDTSVRDHYSTSPMNRAKVHPLWTGSIDSHYQNIEDLGVQPIGEEESVQLTTQLIPIVIKDSTYCCEDIKKEWIAAGLPPRFAARIPAGQTLKKIIFRGEYGIVESSVLEQMEIVKTNFLKEMDRASSDKSDEDKIHRLQGQACFGKEQKGLSKIKSLSEEIEAIFATSKPAELGKKASFGKEEGRLKTGIRTSKSTEG